ncbi:MAG: AAA family ATPase [Bacteroidales bacterium]|nr:AAA family ATPase [Bacteroidales bacterium]
MREIFLRKCLNYFSCEPTTDQIKALNDFSNFIYSDNKIFILNGYAGTGKTTLISNIIRALDDINIAYVLLAPTGRAAKVLSEYCNRSAYTIHKYIYRQLSLDDFIFVLDFNKHRNTFFIIDESSLISCKAKENEIFGSGNLLEDLLRFVFSQNGNKLVFVGDTAQLPPVNEEYPAALNKEYFEGKGYKTVFSEMKEVVRVNLSSLIYSNATLLRDNILQKKEVLPEFNFDNSDFVKVNRKELLDNICRSYDKKGISQVVVICYSNKIATLFNKGIRNNIFNYSDEVVCNEMLMVVKNNYYIVPEYFPVSFIANGEIAKVIKLGRTEEKYGYRFKNVLLDFCNYNGFEIKSLILLDTLYSNSPSLSDEQTKKLVENIFKEEIRSRISKKRKVKILKENAYFNALQVKYAYAITCHKSQGGQWKDVYIDLSFLHYTPLSEKVLKWLYTAITRATEKVFIIY